MERSVLAGAWSNRSRKGFGRGWDRIDVDILSKSGCRYWRSSGWLGPRRPRLRYFNSTAGSQRSEKSTASCLPLDPQPVQVIAIDRVLAGIVVVVTGATLYRVYGKEATESGVVGAGTHLNQARDGVELLVPAAGPAFGRLVGGSALERGAVGVVRIRRGSRAGRVGFCGEVAVAVVVEVTEAGAEGGRALVVGEVSGAVDVGERDRAGGVGLEEAAVQVAGGACSAYALAPEPCSVEAGEAAAGVPAPSVRGERVGTAGGGLAVGSVGKGGCLGALGSRGSALYSRRISAPPFPAGEGRVLLLRARTALRSRQRPTGPARALSRAAASSAGIASLALSSTRRFTAQFLYRRVCGASLLRIRSPMRSWTSRRSPIAASASAALVRTQNDSSFFPTSKTSSAMLGSPIFPRALRAAMRTTSWRAFRHRARGRTARMLFSSPSWCAAEIRPRGSVLVSRSSSVSTSRPFRASAAIRLGRVRRSPIYRLLRPVFLTAFFATVFVAALK